MANLITTAALAQRLNVSSETILKMVRRGTIPAVKLSRRAYRFDPDAVEWALARLGVEQGNGASPDVQASSVAASETAQG